VVWTKCGRDEVGGAATTGAGFEIRRISVPSLVTSLLDDEDICEVVILPADGMNRLCAWVATTGLLFLCILIHCSISPSNTLRQKYPKIARKACYTSGVHQHIHTLPCCFFMDTAA
jgi:hypothetical protein